MSSASARARASSISTSTSSFAIPFRISAKPAAEPTIPAPMIATFMCASM
jgi:hypothetical protein